MEVRKGCTYFQNRKHLRLDPILSVDPDRHEGFINIFRWKKPTDEQQAELVRQADSHMSKEKLEAFLEALEKKEKK